MAVAFLMRLFFFATLVIVGQPVNEQQHGVFHDPDAKVFQCQEKSQWNYILWSCGQRELQRGVFGRRGGGRIAC